jgi:cysteine desulfurase/selenocysteine lyase
MNPDIRKLFPGAAERVYLDIAARCLLPDPVRRAVERHLDMRVHVGGDKEELWKLVEGARGGFAALIGAEPDEIAITKNVSEGLNLFGASLPWQMGDNVVLCPGLEHPNNIYLWYALRERCGIEVRTVEPVDGRLPVEEVAAASDDRTRLITFPSISFAPGFLTDVTGLVEVARSVGALTLVDAAQSVGAHQTDVRALGVDALAVATQKCLLSVYGTGFLYIRRAVAESLAPIHVARYGIDLEGAHETAFSDEGRLHYRAGARRFDVGNYNYAGAAAAGAALDLLRGWDVAEVQKHVRGLAGRLAEGFLELGLPVAGGAPGPQLAHIVSVGRSGGGRHYTADDPSMNSLRARLLADGIHHSIRSGVLRFSVGVYNDEGDVEATLASARGWSRGSRH